MRSKVNFPLALGWLAFSSTSHVDVPVTLEGISFGLESELVVSESIAGLAVAVVDADSSLSLSSLRESILLPVLLVFPAELG